MTVKERFGNFWKTTRPEAFSSSFACALENEVALKQRDRSS